MEPPVNATELAPRLESPVIDPPLMVGEEAKTTLPDPVVEAPPRTPLLL
jgi:hypothetical protein